MNICTEGQGFGGNATPVYKSEGLVAHPGQDWGCGWGTPITSRYDGYAYKVWSFDLTPAADGYTQVAIIVDDGLESFEWVVGHLNPSVLVGTQVKKGDIIGTEANHGPVYSGNIPISVALQKTGDQRGHHRHYQKRPFMWVQKTSGVMLQDDRGPWRNAQGQYAQTFNYNGGYDGCVDPTLPVFNRLIAPLYSGYDVYVLQRILCKYGFMNTATGFFGSQTFTALQSYQRARGISPVGFAGPQTRAALTKELQPLPDLSGE
jgi:hypothetical protein